MNPGMQRCLPGLGPFLKAVQLVMSTPLPTPIASLTQGCLHGEPAFQSRKTAFLHG